MMKPLKTNSGMTQTQVQQWRQGGESEKRVVFLLFSVLLSAIASSVLLLSVSALPAAPPQMGGQYPGRHGRSMQMGPDQQLARMTKELKLTKDQQAKIKPILADEYQQMSQLRQDTSISRQDKRAKFMDIRTKAMGQIRPLLTDKQQAKLRQIEQQREQRMRSWQSRHGATSDTGSQ
jgi:periplasmic protein CpxP/Spy